MEKGSSEPWHLLQGAASCCDGPLSHEWGVFFGSREVQHMGITGAWLGCGGCHPLQEVFAELCALPELVVPKS